MTTHALFFAGFLLLPLLGLWTWRIEVVRRMDLGGRIAVAGAAGALTMALVMALLSLLDIRWSRTVLFPIAFAIAGGGWLSARRMFRPLESRPIRFGIWVFVLLTCYGLLTARESAGDLHFFWGPKAVAFYHDGGVDPAFLANKTNPNADYPPLLPLLYAWAQLVAHRFSWWASVLATALFLFGSVAIVRTLSRDDHGALLVAATLSWTSAIGFAAGGADPPLIFFETLALAALTFRGENGHGHDLLAAIGLAGAVWTKIEGATFVIAVVLAIIIVQRSVKRALLLATPAFVLFAGWLVFLLTNGLVFGYGGATMQLYFNVLPQTLLLTAKAALFELYGLPWIVPLVLILFGRSRRAALPLVVGMLTVGATIFFYIHLPDPAWWIAASAPRVLLTPLMALLIAAVAANGGPDQVAAHDLAA